tara:strand:+ start:125 stop:445 length:321 start_codon:yes stop_codon:yes gene_type:complete
VEEYYENRDEQFSQDCHELNEALGNAMDKITDALEDEHSEALIANVIPTVLITLTARHFKHFFYDSPKDILNYLNFIKKVFVRTCDDSDELDMVNDLDYNKQGANA